MKRMVVISGILVILFLLSVSAFAQGPSYVMICKGGGEMKAQLYSGVLRYPVFITAKGGTRAAKPGPGECVWVDRGMRAEEMRGRWISLGFPPSLFGNSLLRITVWVKQGNISMEVQPPKANKLYKAVYNGNTFYLHARRTGEGEFEVTKIGP